MKRLQEHRSAQRTEQSQSNARVHHVTSAVKETLISSHVLIFSSETPDTL